MQQSERRTLNLRLSACKLAHVLQSSSTSTKNKVANSEPNSITPALTSAHIRRICCSCRATGPPTGYPRDTFMRTTHVQKRKWPKACFEKWPGEYTLCDTPPPGGPKGMQPPTERLHNPSIDGIAINLIPAVLARMPARHPHFQNPQPLSGQINTTGHTSPTLQTSRPQDVSSTPSAHAPP